jgi:hypothetical protein
MIELGKEGRDKVTGFQGIITGRSQFLTGCDQYNLVPPMKDGKLDAVQWFDEGRIEIVGPGISAADVAGPKPGGPQRDAPPARG